jgi:Rieske Fe-S protein
MILTSLVIILAVLPWHIQAAPKPLYQVLGAAQDFSANAIEVAYQQARKSLLSVKTKEQGAALKLIEIEHAYEVLSNDLRRRDYDLFQIDELQSRIAEAKKQYANSPVESIPFPLWEPPPAGKPVESTTVELTKYNFAKLVLDSNDTWLVQAYSNASPNSHKFVHIWNRAGVLLEGVAKLGRVELGETPLSFLLAERTQATTQRVFRHGLPEIVAFTPSCRHLGCLTRFRGE